MAWIIVAAYLLIGFVTSVLFCKYGWNDYDVGDIAFQIGFWPMAVIGSILYFVAWAAHKLAGNELKDTYRSFIS